MIAALPGPPVVPSVAGMKLIRAFGLAIGGVLAVHTGPAVLILAGAAVWLRRHWRRTHRLSSAA